MRDTRQLAAFCAVVERKSFSQAAERLGVTQPAVSLQVRALEKRLGTQLLDRSGRRVEPTEAGLRLYRGAQRMLALEDQIVSDVSASAEGELAGDLVLGASTGPAAIAVPLLLCEFQRESPGVRVFLTVSDTHAVVERVASRELELGIVGAARRHRGVRFEPFFSDEVILACPPGHRFAGRTISLDELREESIVLMQEGAGVRQVVEDALRRQGSACAISTCASSSACRSRCGPRSRPATGSPSSRGRRSRRASRRGRSPRRTSRAWPRRGRSRSHRRRGGPRPASRTRSSSSPAAGCRRDRPLGRRRARPLLRELGIERPLLVTSARFGDLELPVTARFTGVRRHSPLETVAAATSAAAGADGLVGVGGGSAIDTAKAVSAGTRLELVAIPTTYAGAEWTPYFGMRDEVRGLKTGGGGARTAAAVYEPGLTLDLPVGETVGTALNALAHAAEALYAGACEDATTGARLIGGSLEPVVRDGHDLSARTSLLEGAMHAGRALGERGLFLGHALAQALGGRYGLPHGAMNALSLPPALRFNEAAVPDAIAALGGALGTDDPAGGSRSSLAWEASRGCVTSASPRRTCRRSRRKPRRGRARAPIRDR